MFGNKKKEFGDYQTPIDFCYKVCNYIKENKFARYTRVILEPTCGIGNFLIAASNTFEHIKLIGIEINEMYANIAKTKVPSAKIEIGNIFNITTKNLCNENSVLIIGNPPWATNSNLYFNLPKKTNFRGLRGIDALTGASNFDICEYIILKLLNEYKYTNSTICMLCKTSVARKVILEISRKHIACQKVEMLNFNSNKTFGVSVPACVLVIELSADKKSAKEIVCEIKDFDTKSILNTLVVNGDTIKTISTKTDLEGKCQFVWRQGVKHDCGKIMELDFKKGEFINKNKSVVHIENGLVFPLAKSSCFKKAIIHEFSKFVIVTQTKPKQDTLYIRSTYPLTWKYLNDNVESFNKRKSVIYKKSAPFSMFGIGDYSFAPYKVGISGFYKKPLFCLLSSNKPVMTDDTAYFLAFYNYDIAYSMMLLLNSKTVQEFLLSIAFIDNKRPYTVKLLSRLDIQKCINVVSFEELKKTEKTLQLAENITKEMYENLAQFIRTQSQKDAPILNGHSPHITCDA